RGLIVLGHLLRASRGKRGVASGPALLPPPQRGEGEEKTPCSPGMLLTLLGHFRAKVFQVGLFVDGTDDAEPDELGTGQPPDTLRTLRIELDPFLVRAAPGGAAAILRRIVPRAAAGDMREPLLGRQPNGLQGQLVGREGG